MTLEEILIFCQQMNISNVRAESILSVRFGVQSRSLINMVFLGPLLIVALSCCACPRLMTRSAVAACTMLSGRCAPATWTQEAQEEGPQEPHTLERPKEAPCAYVARTLRTVEPVPSYHTAAGCGFYLALRTNAQAVLLDGVHVAGDLGHVHVFAQRSATCGDCSRGCAPHVESLAHAVREWVTVASCGAQPAFEESVHIPFDYPLPLPPHTSRWLYVRATEPVRREGGDGESIGEPIHTATSATHPQVPDSQVLPPLPPW